MLKEVDVAALSVLPSPVRIDLRFAMCQESLGRFPLFRFWVNTSAPIAKEFCAECIDFVHLEANEVIFSAGRESEQAYFLGDGTVKYTQDPRGSVESVPTQTCVQDQCLCEVGVSMSPCDQLIPSTWKWGQLREGR